MKKTKILCTIGPACNTEVMIRRMVESGMNAARINTSHGDFVQYKEMIRNVRNVENIPIVMDTQGPKIRLRLKRNIKVFTEGKIRVGFSDSVDNYLDADVYDHLKVGDRALIDDGAFEAFIAAKQDRCIVLQFANEGTIISGKAVNFPQKNLPLNPLTEKDKESLEFATKNEIDYIALSFTRGKEDIDECRKYLKNSNVKIIAKIENQQGIDNIEEIIQHADGIMVARGDMGVELNPEAVPIIQKELIKKSNYAGKLVITATQMLQSMIDNPRPTRAEISDVANAILDGSGVVMLSGETATGKYPVETVKMMARIAQYAEKFVDIQDQPAVGFGTERAICDSIKKLCNTAGVNVIVSVTRRGYTARLISRLRLQPPILALTSEPRICRQLHLYYGVNPVMFPNLPGSIRTVTAGMYLYEKGYIQPEDQVLYASGEYLPSDFKTNTLQIVKMKDLIHYCESYEKMYK